MRTTKTLTFIFAFICLAIIAPPSYAQDRAEDIADQNSTLFDRNNTPELDISESVDEFSQNVEQTKDDLESGTQIVKWISGLIVLAVSVALFVWRANRENKPENVYLGIGSNLGDSRENLLFAINALNNSKDPEPNQPVSIVEAVSSVYETEPVGGPEQNNYLNIVVKVLTFLSPEDLLDLCDSIEQSAGRERTVQNAPRTLDIDILLYGNRTINLPDLIIPHPRMNMRNFVIKPLQELLPNYQHGGSPEGKVWKVADLEWSKEDSQS